jgi:hypothetical protein
MLYDVIKPLLSAMEEWVNDWLRIAVIKLRRPASQEKRGRPAWRRKRMKMY